MSSSLSVHLNGCWQSCESLGFVSGRLSKSPPDFAFFKLAYPGSSAHVYVEHERKERLLLWISDMSVNIERFGSRSHSTSAQIMHHLDC